MGTWIPEEKLGQCGKKFNTERNGKIFGGQFAKLGEFTFMALFGYKHSVRSKKFYLCGGSVINAKYILTAAHCTIKDDPPIRYICIKVHIF